jgi:hypothetical protein
MKAERSISGAECMEMRSPSWNKNPLRVFVIPFIFRSIYLYLSIVDYFYSFIVLYYYSYITILLYSLMIEI